MKDSINTDKTVSCEENTIIAPTVTPEETQPEAPAPAPKKRKWVMPTIISSLAILTAGGYTYHQYQLDQQEAFAIRLVQEAEQRARENAL